ncbi:1,4-alpha-glucan branching protein GlgB [Kytococcus sedentarius]|uniref:1,4-alpha-glucan branching protein GlgB n=1 Tax=Kytococcus sedentarius TaxID=1276 RepID=UPI001950D1C3|nr:1,4-alpha-glucan branching protein GlgB [Kytococcus sedentarius]QRO88010.1 1,4-alpha-glucan branching protein GlgB [Kytococcus sedentarius]
MSTATLKHLLEDWLPRQRWFAGKGHTPRLQRIGTVRMGDVVDPAGQTVALSTVYVADRATVPATVYQVPLSVHPLPSGDAGDSSDGPGSSDGSDGSGTDAGKGAAQPVGGRIGEISLATLGLSSDPLARGTVHDAAHDPAYAAAVMAMADRESTYGQGVATMRGNQLRPRRPHKAPYIVTGSRVLPGEQSNTSIIVTTLGGRPNAPQRETAIVKLFRVVQVGANPDVELQLELARQGSTVIPTPLGAVEGSWPDPETGEERRGHLAFASEYLGDVDDAWRVALRSAARGKKFLKRARRLGESVAHVHAELATALGTVQVDHTHRQELTDRLRTRLQAALAQAPELEPLRAEATARIDALEALSWPALQRVHGDLHLGQVLDVPDRGWVVLDFEGEPLRPVAERRAPDLPLRDVAGMLRSFDYVAGSLAHEESEGTDHEATLAAWVQGVRAAFLEGYRSVAGDRGTEPRLLLEALEVDKAFYEVVYERHNRPDWVDIPVSALERLLGTSVGSAEAGTEPGEPGAAAPSGTAATEPSAEEHGTTGTTASARPQGGATRLELAPAPQDGHPGTQPTSPPAEPTDPAGISREEAHRIVEGRSHDPHAVLGLHPVADGIVIRALRPRARRVVALLPDGSRHELHHLADGIFGAHLPGQSPTDYRLEVVWPLPATADEARSDHAAEAEPRVQDDGYRYLPGVGEMDLHLIGEGRHERLWTVLGAHVRTHDGPMGASSGVAFTVWAPHAHGVRVVGDFNHWDGTGHPMRALGSSGVWELFVPGIGAGERYKFQITTAQGTTVTKADPMARRTELPPATASIVDDSHAEGYPWTDADWLARRAEGTPQTAPMSTYEVHLGSWRQGLGYTELAEQLVQHVTDLGFTHVELLPVAEHPYAPSWGYQVTGYYAPTSRFGSPDEFRHLVDALHAAGIGVILDWVPGHFPKDEWALARFDGQPLYEHPDPRRGDQPDWGTHVFDFGRHEVRNFLVANVLYWMEEFHVDGIRVDAVASMLYLDYSRAAGEWLPNQYGGRENLEAVQLLQETNATAHRLFPGIVTIAEESTAWPGVTAPTHEGGLGFSMKWNMGWMHDTLEYASKDPVHRQFHHHELTFSMVYAYSENYVLPISHDEVVHGKGSLVTKMPGDTWQKYAGVRVYLAFMWAHPGKKLLFMGSELGVPREWSEGTSLDFDIAGDPLRHGVQSAVRDLNRRYAELPALWQLDHQPTGFRWIDAENAAGNLVSFLRFGERPGDPGGTLAVLANFSGAPHEDFRVGLPHAGRWREVLNTDAVEYGGSGVGNLGEVVAEDVPWDGLPASAVVRVPPLGAVWFTPVQEG